MADAETRRAERLVHVVAIVGIVTYVLLALVVNREAYLVRLGRTQAIEFALARAESLDRDAKWGDRKVVWVVGSSITRDAIDEEDLRTLLLAAGHDWGVEKYGFGSGAPIFTWPFTRRLPIRPGDEVVTSVAYDNFRAAWLAHHEGTSDYIQLLFTPDETFAVDELALSDRVEYSLAATPPRAFWRWRDAFQTGTRRAWFGLVNRGQLPTPKPRHGHEPYDPHERYEGFEDKAPRARARLADDELQLDEAQINYAALMRWVAEAEAAGARPWVFHVPHHPQYYEAYIEPETVQRYHDALGAALPRFRALPAQPDEAYMDYKHPNSIGRPVLTRELAAWLADVPVDSLPVLPPKPVKVRGLEGLRLEPDEPEEEPEPF